MKFAIMRDVSPSIDHCELTHLERLPIDFDRARRQHENYSDVLSRYGWTTIRMPALADLPDSVFVEDGAVVFDDLAILASPGAASRRPEIASLAELLSCFRKLSPICLPATLDGGDVLVAGTDVWVGTSARTNELGAEALRTALNPLGYAVHIVRPHGCLHLKSAVTRASFDCLIVHPGWIDPEEFTGWTIIEVDRDEPFAANVLWLGDVTLTAESHPRTRSKLQAHGIKCHVLDMSELAKAEGGLTCCSLLFDA